MTGNSHFWRSLSFCCPIIAYPSVMYFRATYFGFISVLCMSAAFAFFTFKCTGGLVWLQRLSGTPKRSSGNSRSYWVTCWRAERCRAQPFRDHIFSEGGLDCSSGPYSTRFFSSNCAKYRCCNLLSIIDSSSTRCRSFWSFVSTNCKCFLESSSSCSLSRLVFIGFCFSCII